MSETKNTNCLEGIACPECGQADGFKIAVTAWAYVVDDGLDHVEDAEWDDKSPVVCPSCHHEGTVGQFRQEKA